MVKLEARDYSASGGHDEKSPKVRECRQRRTESIRGCGNLKEPVGNSRKGI